MGHYVDWIKKSFPSSNVKDLYALNFHFSWVGAWQSNAMQAEKEIHQSIPTLLPRAV